MDMRPEDDKLFLDIVVPDIPDLQIRRQVKWLAGKRLLVEDSADVSAAAADGLARAVECCDTDGDPEKQKEQLGELEKYGELLFDAAFGIDNWKVILAAVVAAEAPYLEVAVKGAADGDYAALQALRWEALHDGSAFVAAQGSTHADQSIPVGVVRLITTASVDLKEITHTPKVLFAVGSHLTHPDVRPGAEFMGIMRRLDRDGGYIQARVLESATRPKLVDELKAFNPDVLHLIGHGKLDGKQVKVQLRDDTDTNKDYYAPAEELLSAFAEACHWPAMVVLSACQTASAASGPGIDPGRVSALPFAARLVAGNGVSRGVPVVVAMAGDISDTACRVFTQALTTTISKGITLGKAVIHGRRAAFYRGPGQSVQHPVPDSGHWVMPSLFLAASVAEEARLVQTAPARAARERVKNLDLVAHPVFYGRVPFFTAFDRLLTSDVLNVLVAYTPDQYRRFGGWRLLQELAARAVRCNVLPVLLGEHHADDGPDSLEQLVLELADGINLVRARLLNLDPCESEAVAAVRVKASRVALARAIRRDLDALVATLPEDDPVRHRPAGQPQTVLLCHHVDGWTALDHLLDLLGPKGLDGGTTPVPLVLTGADVRSLKHARNDALFGRDWIKFELLDRFMREQNEDILAYQWWLLNPPVALDGQQLAFAPKRGGTGDWKNALREVLDDKDAIYDPVVYRLAKTQTSGLVSASDDALLASYAQVLA